MDVLKIYNKIIKDIGKIKTKDEQFNTMFILTCLLVDNLSCQGKSLDLILQLLSEFDYEKNFRGDK